MGFFDKIKAGLKKTRESISGQITQMLNSFTKIDEELFEELEELLIMGDVSMRTAEKICEDARRTVKERGITDPNEVMGVLEEIVANMLDNDVGLHLDSDVNLILVVGVNGVGKTTSIGKLANLLKNDGKDVALVAADTFRAAAIEQIEIWSQRVDVPLIKQQMGTDPGSVVFDGLKYAKANKKDVVICDTAGRLHNKSGLMAELSKIDRITQKVLGEDAEKEVLLVLDAATGQNAINQAREFMGAVKVTGIILTKLDGTAKGGVVLTINQELGLPIKFIGVGEKIDDLQEFDAKDFAKALFQRDDK